MNSKLTRWCDGFLEAGWLLAVITTPLFFNIHSDRVFEPDKITLLRSIALMMTLVWVVKLIEQQAWKDRSWLQWRSENSIWKMPLVLPMLFVAGCYLVSSLFSVAPRTSLFGSYQRLQGTYTTFSYMIIFGVILGNLRRQEQIQRFVTTVIVVSIPASIYGMLQHYKIDPLPWGGNTSTRIAGHMGNAIFLSAYLIMAVPLTVTRIIDSFKNILTDEELSYADVIRSAIYILALVVQLIATYWTQSRGPLLGIAIGLFAYVLILLVTLRNVARQSESGSLGKDLVGPLVFVGLGIASVFMADMFAPRSGGLSLVVWLGATGLLLLGIFVMTAMRRGWRWLWLAWLGMVGLTGVVMTVYNVSTQLGDDAESTPVIGTLNDMFDEWRGLPTIGRFGRMLDTEEGTSTVRLLIWEGVVDLVSPHEPIESPVGGADTWNFMRPLIGYGPEAMYVAYNRYYPPELAVVEARNASPDRAHNETFDALVITGILGYVAWQVLYVATFYYGLRYLGVVNGKRERNLLYGLWFAGAVVGTVLALMLGGAVYIGVAAPFGSIIGLILYFIYYALLGSSDDEVRSYDINTLLMASLIAAMIAYYIEIHFGIAIVSTRTHAFAYTALIVVLGSGLLKDRVSQAEQAGDAGALATKVPVRKSKARRAPVLATNNWLVSTLICMGLMTAIMTIFMFGFTNYTVQPGQQISTLADIPSAGDIFHRAFFVNPRQGFIDSPYLFGVVLFSWVLGTLLFVCEMVKEGSLKLQAKAAPTIGNLRIAGGVLIALALVGLTAFLGEISAETQHVLRTARTAGTFFAALSLAGAAAVLIAPNNGGSRALASVVGAIAVLFAIPMLLADAPIQGILLAIGGAAVAYLLWRDSFRNFSMALLIIGLGSLAIGLLYALTHAGLMREVMFLAPDATEISAAAEVVREGIRNGDLFVSDAQAETIGRRLIEAERIERYLSYFYLFLFATFFFTASVLGWRSMSAERKSGSVPGLVALAIALVLGVYLIDISNLNVIQGDMIYKRGKPFDQQASNLLNQGVRSQEAEQQQQAFQGAVQNWQIASTIYEGVVDMTPNEDFYFLWLGRSYLEQSRLNASQQDVLLEQARLRLENAQRINPLNTDHTANLARLYTRRADIARNDEATRSESIELSKGYYEDALALSPQNSLIRNEYANLYYQLDNDCERGLEIYEESAAIDPLYDRTYISMADTYLRCAQSEAEQREAYLEASFDTTENAIAGVPVRLQRDAFNNSMASLRLRTARQFSADGNTARAKEIAETALELAIEDAKTPISDFLSELEAAISAESDD